MKVTPFVHGVKPFGHEVTPFMHRTTPVYSEISVNLKNLVILLRWQHPRNQTAPSEARRRLQVDARSCRRTGTMEGRCHDARCLYCQARCSHARRALDASCINPGREKKGFSSCVPSPGWRLFPLLLSMARLSVGPEGTVPPA